MELVFIHACFKFSQGRGYLVSVGIKLYDTCFIRKKEKYIKNKITNWEKRKENIKRDDKIYDEEDSIEKTLANIFYRLSRA